MKLIIGITIASQHNEQPLLTGPLELNVHFFLPVPKSRKSLSGSLHITRPDSSNLIKWVEDIATSIIYHDDCLIAVIHSTKTYDSKPRTEFTLREL